MPRALAEAVAIARLMASVIDGLELHPARFEQIARESFVTAADVSDVLALHAGLDYRSAHKVVGRAVRDLVDAGDPPSALTAARLSAAAEEAIGRPLEIDPEILRAALDPAACAAARLQIGSSSPDGDAARCSSTSRRRSRATPRGATQPRDARRVGRGRADRPGPRARVARERGALPARAATVVLEPPPPRA